MKQLYDVSIIIIDPVDSVQQSIGKKPGFCWYASWKFSDATGSGVSGPRKTNRISVEFVKCNKKRPKSAPIKIPPKQVEIPGNFWSRLGLFAD